VTGREGCDGRNGTREMGRERRDDEFSLALPHLIIEFKGPEGSMLVSQCAYNAAFLVHGHDMAMKHLNKHVANVFSMATNGDSTTTFGHFAMTDDRVTYHQCSLLQLPPLTSTYEHFTQTCLMIHNLQHLARERSATLRDMLEEAEAASKSAASAAMPPPAPPSSKRSASDPGSSSSKRARVEGRGESDGARGTG
jgi:hypothetical protein